MLAILIYTFFVIVKTTYIEESKACDSSDGGICTLEYYQYLTRILSELPSQHSRHIHARLYEE